VEFGQVARSIILPTGTSRSMLDPANAHASLSAGTRPFGTVQVISTVRRTGPPPSRASAMDRSRPPRMKKAKRPRTILRHPLRMRGTMPPGSSKGNAFDPLPCEVARLHGGRRPLDFNPIGLIQDRASRNFSLFPHNQCSRHNRQKLAVSSRAIPKTKGPGATN
jgi:hypothetical protein